LWRGPAHSDYHRRGNGVVLDVRDAGHSRGPVSSHLTAFGSRDHQGRKLGVTDVSSPYTANEVYAIAGPQQSRHC
jgi:hypothetical protein